MKNIIKIIITILFFICISSTYAEEKIREDWIRDDKIFISEVIKVLKQHPLQIDKLLLTDNEKENLGFGYYFIGGSNGKGYVSIFYQFIYKNNKLLSFRLDPEMPTNNKLIPTYKKIYTDIFQFDDKNKIKPYYYNLSEVAKPLPGFKLDTKVSEKVRYYMTPFSGITYGIRGGYANSLLKNRTKFITIEKEINYNTCLMLLYSINPASRLTAYEYYLLHQGDFSKKGKEKIEKRMEIIFKELPNITTMYGCIVTTAKSKDRVKSILEELKYYKKL